MILPHSGVPQYSSRGLPPGVEDAARSRAVLSRWTRASLVTVGVLLLVLLGTACWLSPSPNRMGTHQQLGLPPCTFLTFTGRRCPSCGMTTAWAHVMRGQLPSAVGANAGGTVLALLALVYVPWLIISGLRGRWLWRPPREMTLVFVALGITAITLVDWGLRLAWKL